MSFLTTATWGLPKTLGRLNKAYYGNRRPDWRLAGETGKDGGEATISV